MTFLLRQTGSSFGNLLTFGDRSSGGIGGTTAMDFISWTNGYFDVPEPSSAILAGMAGLLFIWKRGKMRQV